MRSYRGTVAFSIAVAAVAVKGLHSGICSIIKVNEALWEMKFAAEARAAADAFLRANGGRVIAPLPCDVPFGDGPTLEEQMAAVAEREARQAAAAAEAAAMAAAAAAVAAAAVVEAEAAAVAKAVMDIQLKAERVVADLRAERCYVAWHMSFCRF